MSPRFELIMTGVDIFRKVGIKRVLNDAQGRLETPSQTDYIKYDKCLKRAAANYLFGKRDQFLQYSGFFSVYRINSSKALHFSASMTANFPFILGFLTVRTSYEVKIYINKRAPNTNFHSIETCEIFRLPSAYAAQYFCAFVKEIFKYAF